MQNIIKAEIEFKNNEIEKITVFVQSKDGGIQAIYSSTAPRSGYLYLEKNIPNVNQALLQEIADYGIKVNQKITL